MHENTYICLYTGNSGHQCLLLLEVLLGKAIYGALHPDAKIARYIGESAFVQSNLRRIATAGPDVDFESFFIDFCQHKRYFIV